jgi:hypothetical protein
VPTPVKAVWITLNKSLKECILISGGSTPTRCVQRTVRPLGLTQHRWELSQ